MTRIAKVNISEKAYAIAKKFGSLVSDDSLTSLMSDAIIEHISKKAQGNQKIADLLKEVLNDFDSHE